MNFVIIGGSAAGLSACESIRELDKKGDITLISDEKEPLYSRCLLTYLISGKLDKDRIKFKNGDFYKENKIEAIHGVKAVSLDVKIKTVTLDNSKTVKYDKLLIATGASPKKLNIAGEEKRGVFDLRNIEDAKKIMSALDKVETIAILGGGLIGLRDAYALRLRGKKVKVFVKSPQVLSQMLDKDAADIIESRLTANGIEIIKGVAATGINGKDSVSGITLEGKKEIPCQMVIVGKGVTPNTDIVKGTGIDVKEGIVINGQAQTSAKDVYAAGDVAEAMDIITGSYRVNAIWPVAVEQGRIAGLNMAGKKAVYDGSSMMNSVDFYDLATISIGITKPKEAGFEELVHIDNAKGIYKKIVIKDNIICGAILVNEVGNAGVYGILIKKRIDISSVKDILLSRNFDYAKILSIVNRLPDKFDSEEFKESVITFNA